MLYYWLHIIYIFITAKFFPKKIPIDTTITRKRTVNIFDCEGFKYMSNTRYISYMDFIRLELTFKSYLFDHTIKKGITPILGSQKIIYKKPLKLWDTFTITLRNEGWDDKWVYHSHVFKKEDYIYAIGYTKVAFWKNKEIQNLRVIISDCGITNLVKTPSEAIKNIFNNDYKLLKSNT